MKLARIAFWAFLMAAFGCAPEASVPKPAEPPSLLVFAAASTTEALESAIADFRRDHTLKMESSFGSSATLAAQILQGARPDLFLSASEEWAEKLEKEGLVEDRRNLLGNELVLVIPSGSTLKIQAPADLAQEAVRHIALADPESAPAGKYAREALTKLGLWERVKSKVVAGDDVRQALLFVETGEADAGIVYATDAASTGKVTVAARIDRSLTKPIRYPLVLLKTARENPAARQFYDYLCSPAAATAFRARGFVPLLEVPSSAGSKAQAND